MDARILAGWPPRGSARDRVVPPRGELQQAEPVPERVGEDGDAAPDPVRRGLVDLRASFDGTLHRRIDVGNHEIDMHRGPVARVIARPRARCGRRSGGLREQVDRCHPTEQLDTVFAEATADGEPERARVERDSFLHVGHIDVDQEIHAPNILRRGHGIRARLQPTVNSQLCGVATNGGPVSRVTAELYSSGRAASTRSPRRPACTKKFPSTYATARATSEGVHSTCPWYRSANTFPLRPIIRFNPRAMRTASPCSPRERRSASGASTTRCRWFPCTEKWTSRNPRRSHAAANARESTRKLRRLRKFHTWGIMRHVTCTGLCRDNGARATCGVPARAPFGLRPARFRLPPQVGNSISI